MASFLKSLHGRSLGLSTKGNLMAGSFLVPKLLYMNEVPSTALTASSTETLLDTFATIKGGMLEKGSLIKISFQGIATATNSTDTLIIKLYIGGLTGTALLTLATTDVADNDVFMGKYELAIRTLGTSGTMVGHGMFGNAPAAEGTITMKNDILASTTINTTINQVIGVGAKWSTTSASNSCRLDFLAVEKW